MTDASGAGLISFSMKSKELIGIPQCICEENVQFKNETMDQGHFEGAFHAKMKQLPLGLFVTRYR